MKDIIRRIAPLLKKRIGVADKKLIVAGVSHESGS